MGTIHAEANALVQAARNGVNISGPNEPGAYATTSLAWDGSHWKVTWGNLTETRLARVDPATGQVLDPNALTLGFARRFAAYKCPNLLLHDPDRLARILADPHRPAQLIPAGKAHPRDAL